MQEFLGLRFRCLLIGIGCADPAVVGIKLKLPCCSRMPERFVHFVLALSEMQFHLSVPPGLRLPSPIISSREKWASRDQAMRCPVCKIPLSLTSLEQIWRGPDFEHRLTYQCRTCGLQFGTEPYEVAEPIQVADALD